MSKRTLMFSGYSPGGVPKVEVGKAGTAGSYLVRPSPSASNSQAPKPPKTLRSAIKVASSKKSA